MLMLNKVTFSGWLNCRPIVVLIAFDYFSAKAFDAIADEIIDSVTCKKHRVFWKEVLC